MMTIINDDLVRERAYFIWEREGRPEGREQEHWQAAVRELEVELGLAKSRAKNGMRAKTVSKLPELNGTPSRKGRIKAMVSKAKDALEGTASDAPKTPEKKRKRPAKADTDGGTRSPQRS